MNTVVMTLNEAELAHMKRLLAPHQCPSKNPYIRFFAKTQGVSVAVYTSGKVVFQGKNAEEIAQHFGYQETATTNTNSPSGQNLPLIGSDEVGNGSYFGGLAVVASFVSPEQHDWLTKIGVADSKALTDTKIRQIAPLLEKNILHKALLLSPQKYNQVVGKDKGHNAVSVKVALHNQAIYLLLKEGATPQKIVIDAFTSRQNYDQYLSQEKHHFQNPITLEEKAEGRYLAVAVSSIIARNLFLENLDNLGKDIGFQLPSGAGQQSDRVASQILAAYGRTGLEHCAKLHFANTEKAYKLLKNK